MGPRGTSPLIYGSLWSMDQLSCLDGFSFSPCMLPTAFCILCQGTEEGTGTVHCFCHGSTIPWETDIDFSSFQALTSFTNPRTTGPRTCLSTIPWITSHESMNPRSTNPHIHSPTNLRNHESTSPRIHGSSSQSSYLGVPPIQHCVLPTAFCTLHQRHYNWHCAALPVLSVLWYGSLLHSVDR